MTTVGELSVGLAGPPVPVPPSMKKFKFLSASMSASEVDQPTAMAATPNADCELSQYL